MFFIKFRTNDLIESTGKQVEFGAGLLESFGVPEFVSEFTINLVYKSIKKDDPLNNKQIVLQLDECTRRGDRKAYANGAHGYSQLKDFFITDLHLTIENNKEDYYAFEKSRTPNTFFLFYFPKFFYDNFITIFNPRQLTVDSSESLATVGSLTPVILYGPPGTGKTHKMQTEYINKFTIENRFITTFHQSFSYEEFVEGLKARTKDNGQIEYFIEKGIFYQACEKAAELAGYVPEYDEDEETITKTALEVCLEDSKEGRNVKMATAAPVLLCIDEINRANVSSVFGDLISLIEPSKRLGAEHEMTVKLPYSKTEFGVPANLLIIGTMNTADRSIQLLDSALRRRFEFEELLPDLTKITNSRAKTILEKINLNICAILNKDHQIGHSYFYGVDNDKTILKVMATQIIPLLEEYFYDNVEKIKAVLGESDKDVDCFYVKDADVAIAFKKYSDEDKEFYKLNEDYFVDDKMTEGDATDIIDAFITRLG